MSDDRWHIYSDHKLDAGFIYLPIAHTPAKVDVEAFQWNGEQPPSAVDRLAAIVDPDAAERVEKPSLLRRLALTKPDPAYFDTVTMENL